MIIFPAIDIYEGKAVRLLRGDYARMTVYNERPEITGAEFRDLGATHIHIVDLEGARNGTTPNLETVIRIKEESGLFCEIGGGIRSMETADRYLGSGIDRAIIGTAAVEDEQFLIRAIEKYGDRIAVGVDIRDGYVAVKGWEERSSLEFRPFCERMEKLGVRTLICTDISRDGAMRGTNRELYRELSASTGVQITASGGVSTMEDVQELRKMDLYGAIIGKAYYTGAIDLRKAIEVAR